MLAHNINCLAMKLMDINEYVFCDCGALNLDDERLEGPLINHMFFQDERYDE